MSCVMFVCFAPLQENTCARCLLKTCICCLWCLEKCLNYLNQVMCDEDNPPPPHPPLHLTPGLC